MKDSRSSTGGLDTQKRSKGGNALSAKIRRQNTAPARTDSASIAGYRDLVARGNRFPTEKEMKENNLIQDRIWMFKTWKECFVAKEVVAFMLDKGYALSAKHAIGLAQEEVKKGNIYYLGITQLSRWWDMMWLD